MSILILIVLHLWKYLYFTFVFVTHTTYDNPVMKIHDSKPQMFDFQCVNTINKFYFERSEEAPILESAINRIQRWIYSNHFNALDCLKDNQINPFFEKQSIKSIARLILVEFFSVHRDTRLKALLAYLSSKQENEKEVKRTAIAIVVLILTTFDISLSNKSSTQQEIYQDICFDLLASKDILVILRDSLCASSNLFVCDFVLSTLIGSILANEVLQKDNLDKLLYNRDTGTHSTDEFLQLEFLKPTPDFQNPNIIKKLFGASIDEKELLLLMFKKYANYVLKDIRLFQETLLNLPSIKIHVSETIDSDRNSIGPEENNNTVITEGLEFSVPIQAEYENLEGTSLTQAEYTTSSDIYNNDLSTIYESNDQESAPMIFYPQAREDTTTNQVPNTTRPRIERSSPWPLSKADSNILLKMTNDNGSVISKEQDVMETLREDDDELVNNPENPISSPAIISIYHSSPSIRDFASAFIYGTPPITPVRHRSRSLSSQIDFEKYVNPPSLMFLPQISPEDTLKCDSDVHITAEAYHVRVLSDDNSMNSFVSELSIEPITHPPSSFDSQIRFDKRGNPFSPNVPYTLNLTSIPSNESLDLFHSSKLDIESVFHFNPDFKLESECNIDCTENNLDRTDKMRCINLHDNTYTTDSNQSLSTDAINANTSSNKLSCNKVLTPKEAISRINDNINFLCTSRTEPIPKKYQCASTDANKPPTANAMRIFHKYFGGPNKRISPSFSKRKPDAPKKDQGLSLDVRESDTGGSSQSPSTNITSVDQESARQKDALNATSANKSDTGGFSQPPSTNITSVDQESARLNDKVTIISANKPAPFSNINQAGSTGNAQPNTSSPSTNVYQDNVSSDIVVEDSTNLQYAYPETAVTPPTSIFTEDDETRWDFLDFDKNERKKELDKKITEIKKTFKELTSDKTVTSFNRMYELISLDLALPEAINILKKVQTAYRTMIDRYIRYYQRFEECELEYSLLCVIEFIHKYKTGTKQLFREIQTKTVLISTFSLAFTFICEGIEAAVNLDRTWKAYIRYSNGFKNMEKTYQVIIDYILLDFSLLIEEYNTIYDLYFDKRHKQ